MFERSQDEDRLILVLFADLPECINLGIVDRQDGLLIVIDRTTRDLEQLIAQSCRCEGHNLLVLQLDQQFLLKLPVSLPSVNREGHRHIDDRGRWKVVLVANNDQAEVAEKRIDLLLRSWAQLEGIPHEIGWVKELVPVCAERSSESLSVIEKPDLSIQVEVVVWHRSAGQPDPLLEHGQILPQRLEPLAGWVLRERQLVDDQRVDRQHLALEQDRCFGDELLRVDKVDVGGLLLPCLHSLLCSQVCDSEPLRQVPAGNLSWPSDRADSQRGDDERTSAFAGTHQPIDRGECADRLALTGRYEQCR